MASFTTEQLVNFFPDLSYLFYFLGVYQEISVDDLKNEKWKKFEKRWSCKLKLTGCLTLKVLLSA